MRISVALVLLLLLSIAPDAQAGVVLPGSVVQGKSIAEWTSDWWNWAVQEPFATNPIADTTGAFANLNQNSPIFFVAGNFGDSTPYVRKFSVPSNRYLLLPLVNYVFWAPEDGVDENALRTLASDNVNSIDQLSFELDGQQLLNPFSHREASPPGGFTLRFAPLLAEIGLSPMDRLAVSDGYWVMLEPLAAGQHEIRFSARQPGQFETDMTLQITAVPEPTTCLIFALGGIVCLRRRNRAEPIEE